MAKKKAAVEAQAVEVETQEAPVVDARGLTPEEAERTDRATNIMLMDAFWPNRYQGGGLQRS